MFLTESAGTSGPSTSVSGRLHERTPHQIDPHLPESCHVGYHRSLLSNPTSSVRCQNAKMPVQRSVQKLHPFWNRTQIYKNEVFCFEKNRDGMLEEVKCWWINKCAYISLRMYIYIYILHNELYSFVYYNICVCEMAKCWQKTMSSLFPRKPTWMVLYSWNIFAFDNVISILRRSSLWFFFPQTKCWFSVHHWFLRDRNPYFGGGFRMSSKRFFGSLQWQK